MTTAHDSAYVGAYLSTFLYGAYIVIAYHCSLVLHHRYKTKRLHMYLLGTHIALFILITWCSATTIARTLYGVFHLAPDGTIDLYPWSTWSLIENVPWALTIIVADAFLVEFPVIRFLRGLIIREIDISHIRRLDAEIYHHSYSFIALCGGRAAIYFLVRIGTSTTTLVQLTNATTIFAAVTLAGNIVCTAQIITLGLRSPIHNVLFDIQAPIIGIVFSMIIIRVSRGEAQGDTNKSTDGIAWHHSTTDESAANVETMFRTITSTHSDDVGAQHEDSKASTETNSESTRYNL
ncbi:uncharacterized protein ARMOST_20201 [Armillaria ostoyae]|uniref:Integral membrane protein n=1 Tax=Armillaria ostoyae TaxID=47428 RepID=A0A284S6M6_ARMOS|nr:uncharacterized protein ARMOST_20201 [Armillaria ostoyae]